MMTINEYTQRLTDLLTLTLASQDVEEVAAETKSHLLERADELRSVGRTDIDAQTQAVAEFGDVSEIATSIAKEFPPKPPFNADRLKWMPEVLVGVFLALSVYVFAESYRLFGFARGMESAVQVYLGSTPMMVIPGLFAALSRIKYRRFRVISLVRRLATYGAFLAIFGMSVLVTLRITASQPLTGIDLMYAGFSTVTVFGYLAMQFLCRDGKMQRAVFRKLRRS